jgi:tetratricopeptide (TPR) repeat protein
VNDLGAHDDSVPEPPETHQMFIHAERGSTVFAVLHGDMHIRNGYPVYQVIPFPMEARRISPAQARQQPSRLLAAERQVVKFAGREQELADLVSWRDDLAPGVSVMLMHGPGGQGKTRLAARFAANSADAGWTAWAAHHVSDPTAQHVVAPGDPGRDLVLIVDYADRWPVDDLQLLLDNPLLRRPQRARVLLVARQAGPWWPAIRHRLGKANLKVGPTMRLPPLAETVSARHRVFADARDAFASVFGLPSTSVSTPEEMDGDAFHLVLTVHMAALVAVDARLRRTTPPSDPVGLSAYLLDREHDFWRALHDHEQIAATPTVMGRTVYTATLTHQLHRGQAVAVIERVGAADAPAADSALDDHAVCYPPSGPGTDMWLEPLYPDRLGEDFLALTTPGHSHPDYPADQWAENAAARLLILADHESPPYTRPVVTTLIETARRWPHIAERQLNSLLRDRPQMAVDAGGSALVGLANLPGVDVGALEAIEERLPSGRHVDLDLGIAALTARLTDHRLINTADASEQSNLYHTLGKRLSNAGLVREALTATEKAVQIRERLAADNPAAYEPDLALSLNNLGKALSDLGDPAQGAAATKRAVDVYRRLARTDQAAYEPGLALALHNLAADLSALGRADDALAAIEQATEIRQRLAAANPAAFEPDLALTVNNLGVILQELGRREQALIASKHAVEIWWRIAADNPTGYAPDLARALVNLGADLSDAGHTEDAVAVTRQGVDIYRRLTRANQAAHEPGLAGALNNLASQLSVLRRPDDALAAAEEAVQIRRRLAADKPAAYESALAWALDKRSVMLAGVERIQDALAAAEEAVQIRERLATDNPAANGPALAESLNNLGKILSDSGHRKQAVAVIERSVDTYRRLAADNPAAHEPGLARTLSNLGVIGLSQWKPQRALAATSESVSIYRRLAVARQGAHGPDLARALWSFALVRAEARKELPAALVAVREAIQILEPLAEDRPTTFVELLLAAYAIAADVLDGLGDSSTAAAMRRLLEKASGHGERALSLKSCERFT